MNQVRAGLSILAVVATVAACSMPSVSPRVTPSPRSSLSPAASPVASTTPAPSPPTVEPCHSDRVQPGPDDVLVYFVCDELPAAARAVVRPTGGGESADRLREALVAVFIGPSASEAADGYEGPVTPGRSDVVIGVAIGGDGAAAIDFDARLVEGTALNASSPRFIFFETVGRTISQFQEIDSVEYRLGGSCDAFEAYFEGPCHFVRERDGIFGDWTLIAADIAGERFVVSEHTRTSLVVEDGLIGGEGPCNSYGAEAEISGSTIVVGSIEASEASCENTESTAFEAKFLGALERASSIRLADGNLIMEGDAVNLVFATSSGVLPSD
jgi:heat shock protein HslJ